MSRTGEDTSCSDLEVSDFSSVTTASYKSLVSMVDKSIDNTIKMVSVKTQYDPMFAPYQPEVIAKKPILQVKISKPKTREQGINTELSFHPEASVFFHEETKLSPSKNQIDSSENNSNTDCDEPKTDLDSSYLIESEDTDSSEEDEEVTTTFYSSSSLATEPKFLVFWSCLQSLFRFCLTCFKCTTITKTATRGSLLIVTMKCSDQHEHKWFSQPIINGKSPGNLLIAASILYSGNTYSRIMEMMNIIHVQFFSGTTYYQHQKNVLLPTINSVYKSYRQKSFARCLMYDSNNVIGDGRCDSPGFSAKYGTYTIMSSDTNEILDFHVVHVTVAGNSSRMEKKGLEILLDKLANRNLKISTLTTDRHVQIRSFLKNEHPEIKHQFDIWHFGKSIKKKIALVAKRKDCQELGAWIKSVINHLWWCCATCNGDAKELKEKWVSILYHVRNQHRWEDHEIFKQCQHPKLTEKRKWLKEGSPSFVALERIVTDKRIIGDLAYLVNFCHTGSLEVFHSVLNKYCTKRLHFSLHGMIARTQLAVMDYNSGANVEQATTKGGSLRFKQNFSRITQSWVVKKIAGKKERTYLEDLIEQTVEATPDETGERLPQVGQVSRNIAPTERPDKLEAIASMRTRFQS